MATRGESSIPPIRLRAARTARARFSFTTPSSRRAPDERFGGSQPMPAVIVNMIAKRSSEQRPPRRSRQSAASVCDHELQPRLPGQFRNTLVSKYG
jgi:hypothetical protein